MSHGNYSLGLYTAVAFVCPIYMVNAFGYDSSIGIGICVTGGDVVKRVLPRANVFPCDVCGKPRILWIAYPISNFRFFDVVIYILSPSFTISTNFAYHYAIYADPKPESWMDGGSDY